MIEWLLRQVRIIAIALAVTCFAWWLAHNAFGVALPTFEQAFYAALLLRLAFDLSATARPKP